MTQYIKLSTMEYPFFIGDILLEYPELKNNFSCPDTYAPIEDSVVPEHDAETQKVYSLGPQKIDGKWILTFEIINMTQEEILSYKIMRDESYKNYLEIVSPPSPPLVENTAELDTIPGDKPNVIG